MRCGAKSIVCILIICALWIGGALVHAEEDDIAGYSIVAVSRLDGELAGVDPTQPVILENGMMFLCRETMPFPQSSPHPEVTVLSRNLTADELRKAGAENPPPGGITSYVLRIDGAYFEAELIH
ncbi:MAG: hypothetical protein PHY31_07075 [Smithellaceae bacterium]|nr:hypothetical protein [Smithellaceae bacterium]